LRQAREHAADLVAHVVGGVLDAAAFLELEIDIAEAVARRRTDGLDARDALIWSSMTLTTFDSTTSAEAPG